MSDDDDSDDSDESEGGGKKKNKKKDKKLNPKNPTLNMAKKMADEQARKDFFDDLWLLLILIKTLTHSFQ